MPFRRRVSLRYHLPTMRRSSLTSFGFLALLLITFTGCGWKQVQYQPTQVVGSVDQEFERLARTVDGIRPISINVKPGYATIVQMTPVGIFPFTINFAEIKEIKLLRKRGWYGVEAFSESGESLCFFQYENENRARQMADVLTALSTSVSADSAKSVPGVIQL